jgi:7-cyano-7-deazaguanine synthase in queuosine biosynthesis
MSRALVILHTGLRQTPRVRRGEFDERIDLRLDGANPNLAIEVENIEEKIVANLSPIAKDLLELASVLYVADTSIRRGDTDVYGRGWQRRIHVVMPMRQARKWNANKELLSELVTYLSGDASITFDFKQHTRPSVSPQFLPFPPESGGFQSAKRIVLFSGGLDSLAGAAELVKAGNVPLLVSHRSSPSRTTLQKSLATELGNKAQKKLPGIGVWITRKDKEAVDNSQRLRSFLYLALAAVIAYELQIESVSYCENGVTTFNLPLSDQRIGSRSTRTTNPKVIKLFSLLVERVMGKALRIQNPFLFWTKRQVVEKLLQLDCAGMVKTALSCTRTYRVEKTKRHCGVCFQCLTRRFAVVSAKAEPHDPTDDYVKDVFKDSLAEGQERGNAVDWVKFNLDMRDCSLEGLFHHFPQLHEALNNIAGNRAENAEAIYRMFQQNAEDVMGALQSKNSELFNDFVKGCLPKDSLFGLIGAQAHLRPAIANYLQQLEQTLSPHLREAFLKQEPQDETELQRQAEIILKAAKYDVEKESPEFVFSIVKTRPDFSFPESGVFLEMKLFNDASKRVQIVDGILADIRKYRRKCLGMLFVVFQTAAFIPDPAKFVADLANEPSVRICVVG